MNIAIRENSFSSVNTMNEIEKIYNSFEEACSKGELSNAEEMIQQLQEMTEENTEVKKIYTRAVAKTIQTFRGKLSTSKVKKLLADVEKIIENDLETDELSINFAKALRHSLVALSTKGQPNVMKEVIINLETLATKYPDNILIHEELSGASRDMVQFWKKRGDFKALRDRTGKFRELAKKFPDNEMIKLNLTKSLVHEIESSKKRDINKVDNLLSEIQLLSESMPANVGLQLEWVHAYRTAMDRTHEKPEDAKRWLNSMKEIALDKKDTAFKVELAKGYLNAISSIGQQNVEELNKHVDEIELLADTTKDNLELQTIYAQSLIVSLRMQGITNFNDTLETINELKELANEFPKNKVILGIHVEALIGIIGMLVQAQKANEIIPLLEQLEELDEKYPNNEFIQQTFDQLSSILKMVGFKRKKTKTKRLDYM